MNFKDNTNVQGTRIFLVSLNLEDSEKYRILRNKDENRKFFFSDIEISKEMQKEWFQKYHKKDDEIMFSVYEKSSEKYIGALGIYHIDRLNKRAEIGRIIIDKSVASGKGYGKEAVNCVMKWAKDKIGIKVFYALIYKKNLASINMFAGCGFRSISDAYIYENGQSDIEYYERTDLDGAI